MPSPDPLGELVERLRVAAGQREVERDRADGLRGSRERVAGRRPAVSRPLRGAPVPDDVAGDALLDEQHALLRDALEVERLRIPARVEAVVPERDGLVEDPLADAVREVAAVLEERQGAQGREPEVEEELGDGVRLEDRAVRAPARSSRRPACGRPSRPPRRRPRPGRCRPPATRSPPRSRTPRRRRRARARSRRSSSGRPRARSSTRRRPRCSRSCSTRTGPAPARRRSRPQRPPPAPRA